MLTANYDLIPFGYEFCSMNLVVGISQLVASKFESRMAHTCVTKKTLTGKCLVWYLKGVFKKRFNPKNE